MQAPGTGAKKIGRSPTQSAKPKHSKDYRDYDVAIEDRTEHHQSIREEENTEISYYC